MDKGFKETDGKLDLSLFPSLAMLEICQVFHYGKFKYSRDNWYKGLKKSELRQAEARHKLKNDLGQIHDRESGLMHLAHRAVQVIMELELAMRHKLEDDMPELQLPIELSGEDIEDLLKVQFNKPKNILMENMTQKDWDYHNAEIKNVNDENWDEMNCPFGSGCHMCYCSRCMRICKKLVSQQTQKELLYDNLDSPYFDGQEDIDMNHDHEHIWSHNEDKNDIKIPGSSGPNSPTYFGKPFC